MNQQPAKYKTFAEWLVTIPQAPDDEEGDIFAREENPVPREILYLDDNDTEEE